MPRRAEPPSEEEEVFAPLAEAYDLLVAAQRALNMNGVELANAVGVAPKTVWRWLGRRTMVSMYAIGDLAPLVHPRDARLAERMHALATKQLARFHDAPPPLPVTEVASPAEAVPAALHASVPMRVELVVYAACRAMNAAPAAVLPGLRAAFAKATELGLTFEEMTSELAPPPRARRARGRSTMA
jgi:hypothetical protein